MGGVWMGGEAENPSVPETDERAAADPPRAERETRPPPDGGEPGPAEDTPLRRRFFADLAKWTGVKPTRLQQRSDRRRLARTVRHELADLTRGEQLSDRDSRHPEISIADSLEGRAVAQWAFGYFVHHRASGSLAGGLAELLTWAVLREFMNELASGVSATPYTKLEAVGRAVDTFLADT